MQKLALVFPVLPGKDARTIAAMLSERPEEYAESRRRLGVQLERVYEMVTPMGTFVIAYWEAQKSFQDITAAAAQSDLAIDKEFARLVAEIHGFDITQPPPVDPPETIGEFADSQVTERKRGLAFCAPVMPGAEDKGREFAKESFQGRLQEHTESRRALGITREVVTLNHTPNGDVVGVYLEGDDPADGNRRFAGSRSEYDVWFKNRCKEIFPPEIDFNEPLPPITEIFDSERVPVSR